ncbi:MAG: EVE domain-containing protein [Planctomycetes bacterium]|nr:EVE domain-containing protein [Planctomycetota bacterium]
MSSRPRYWLIKSEPAVFSWDDLWSAPGRRTHWDGIRNYQARNFIRDDVKRGDLVLFYHSNASPPAAVGVAEVVREAYPDPTQFDPADDHHDPGSDPADPRWLMFDVAARRRLPQPVSLSALKAEPALAAMLVVQRGQRLSIQPVTPAEWEAVLALGGLEPAGAAPSKKRK